MTDDAVLDLVESLRTIAELNAVEVEQLICSYFKNEHTGRNVPY